MSELADRARYLRGDIPDHLRRPPARLQPLQARQGRPTVDVERLARAVADVAVVEPVIAIESPAHWAAVVEGLGPEVDAVLPISIPAYPTEIWNAHPQPLVRRRLPVVFWPLMDFDEPDFWRWSARDMLRALGVEVHIVRSHAHGIDLLKALAMRRFLAASKLVLFGEQNFPWNAHAAGHLVTESLGTQLVVRSLSDFRDRYAAIPDAQAHAVWAERRGRYVEKNVRPEWLRLAVRTYMGIRAVLEEEGAFGEGVNCFGDLLIVGDERDTPCLAQTLLREDGYVASCDGDYLALMSMALATFYLEKTCMMSNMYPVSYVGALEDHFGGDPLSPDPARYPREEWANLARLGHCAFVGVVSPEMTPQGESALHDWGGTWEMKRDGRGCGIDGELAGGEKVTVVELRFDGRTLLIAQAEVAETTRHEGMPHCEATALLRFRDLPGFVENISREHTAVVCGDHVEDLKVLGEALGLTCMVF